MRKLHTIEMHRLTVEEFKEAPKLPLIVVLDDVDWLYFDSADAAVKQLHSTGYFVYSIEQVEGSTSLETLVLDPRKQYAVVLGNEVKGVQQSVIDASDGCLEIPQFGTKHSINDVAKPSA